MQSSVKADACAELTKEKDAKAKPGKDVLAVVWLDVVEAALGAERIVAVGSHQKSLPLHARDTVLLLAGCITS